MTFINYILQQKGYNRNSISNEFLIDKPVKAWYYIGVPRNRKENRVFSQGGICND